MEFLQTNKKNNNNNKTIENEEAFIKEMSMSKKVMERCSASLVKEIKLYKNELKIDKT